MSEKPAPTCTCSDEWPNADPREQVLLIGAGVGLILAGGRAVLRNRPGWFPVWLAGLLAWAVIPKYFICARCENYGKPCDFMYGGKYAALLFKKQDKPFNAAGYFAEGASLSVFQFLPAIAARRDPRSLFLYLLAAGVFQAALIKICCIDCVRFARDPWKARYCPTYKMVAGTGLASPEMRCEGPLE
ncbi:MAG: hypothetical protein ACYC99_03785 [Candidatus Geothermincolia bacterium]